MNTRMTLAEALRRASHDLEATAVPPDLLARLQDRLHGAQPAPAAGPAPAPAAPAPRWSAGQLWLQIRRPWLLSGASVCAAVVVGSVLLMLGGPALEAPVPELRMSGFVPVVPADRWPSEDSAAWLVSTELQRDRLAALGLPFDPSRAGESVRAELLVRPSGQVLAVRFVQ